MKNDFLKVFAQKAKRRLVGKENVPVAKIKVSAKDDEDFRGRVETLMAQEGVVSNPVQYLLDNKKLKGMTDSARERYLLSTLDKYTALRNKFDDVATYDRFCM